MNGSLHIENARIWTGDAQQPWASSLTIQNGRVIPPGRYRRPFDVIDAGGRIVVPGFIDAHIHLLKGGQTLGQLDLSGVRSRGEFEQKISERHRQLAADQWLIASGWSQENWPGGDLPTKAWLRAAGERPTVCYRMDMHMALVNDAVLRLCDLSRVPQGGQIVYNADQEPTGLMIEAAAWQLVNPVIPKSSPSSDRAALLAAQRHAHSLGLTAVGSMEYFKDVQNVFMPLRNRLTLRCRITLLDRGWPMDFSIGTQFENNDQLAVIGFKTFIDGTLGSRTARMLQDYADDPGNRGMLVELAAEGHLLDWARAVAERKLSPSMHAIGDEAARLALDIVEAIPPCRARIEHAQQIDPVDLPRFKGRIASMQPLHKADDGRYVRRRLGENRITGTFAFRSLHDAGAVLAFGSDWPVVSCDPLQGMRAAITGLTFDNVPFGTEQCLTVEETLRGYTSGAAYALGLDDAGVLKEGSVGDGVILDRDPFTADWVNSPPRVECTIVGGQAVYHAASSEIDAHVKIES